MTVETCANILMGNCYLLALLLAGFFLDQQASLYPSGIRNQTSENASKQSPTCWRETKKNFSINKSWPLKMNVMPSL